MQQLLCDEGGFIRSATEGERLLQDDDVILSSLLVAEKRFAIPTSNSKCVQSEIQPCMRGVVTTWMLEVCDDKGCEREVFALAVNYLYRYLAVIPVKKTLLQLLGAACLFLASKLQETLPLTARRLCDYTDNSISLQELTGMELLVLRQLEWHLAVVTPHHFVEHLLRELPVPADKLQLIRKHTHTVIDICATDFTLALYPPSIIAMGSLGASLQGLWLDLHDERLSFTSLTDTLAKITGSDADCLRACQKKIEGVLNNFITATAA